ncbi:2-dehydropantoate 2-reductase [Solibacillus sp. CAU 1738]|uniref:ketopantoate reductase family protein n=1 Tax=Solibacillus sp. CAU 1738 TaxID=3140363 RepID=UPI003260B2A6
MTRIYIIGAGAVGLLMASFLSESGHAVTVVTRRPKQAEKINMLGITRYEINGDQKTFEVQATSKLEITDGAIVIVTTKYDALQSIYPSLAKLRPDVPLLFLQNGLAHMEKVLALQHENITFGSVQFGAQKGEETSVYHRGLGVLKLAIARGDKRVVQLLDFIKLESFSVQLENDAEQMLFEKALLNCFINPLTALLEVKNGQLIHNEHAFYLLQKLYKELMAAFPSVEQTFPFQSVYDLCERTANNTSSMLADRQKNRKLETETIVGAVINKAKKIGQEVPTLQVLYSLLLAVEESGEKM